jgi:hypothetical protein
MNRQTHNSAVNSELNCPPLIFGVRKYGLVFSAHTRKLSLHMCHHIVIEFYQVRAALHACGLGLQWIDWSRWKIAISMQLSF